MLVPPHGERVVDIDELLGQLVQLEPAVGITVHLHPSGRARLDGPVANAEAGAHERIGSDIAQARLVERRLQPRALRGALVIMVEKDGILQPQPIFELAELR